MIPEVQVSDVSDGLGWIGVGWIGEYPLGQATEAAYPFLASDKAVFVDRTDKDRSESIGVGRVWIVVGCGTR